MTLLSNVPPSAEAGVAGVLRDFAARTAEVPTGAQERIFARLQSRIVAGDLGPDLPPSLAGTEVVPQGAQTSALATVKGLGGAAVWRRIGLVLGLCSVATVGWVRPWAIGEEVESARPMTQIAGSSAQRSAAESFLPAPMTGASTGLERMQLGASADFGAEKAPARSGPDREVAPTSTAFFETPQAHGVSAAGKPESGGARPKGTPSKQKTHAGQGALDADGLAAELELLSSARLAMKSGRDADALKALDRHAQQFPKGALAAERDLSRVTVLCRVGDQARAKKIGEALRRRAAGSVWASRLDETCVGPQAQQ